MNNFNTQAAEASLIAIVNTAQQLVDRHGIDFSHAMLVIAEHRLTTIDPLEEHLPLPDSEDEHCELVSHEDTSAVNCHKVQQIGSNNTSGCVGVSWNKKNKNWVAYITVQGQREHLISTENLFDAVCARKSAEAKYGLQRQP